MTPSQSLLLSAFLGDAQSQSVILLSSAYSSSGSINLYVNKLGEIRTLDGWLRQGAARTTDTGASAAMWRSLFPYRRVAAGSITRQLLGLLDDQVNECELWYSTDQGATWTLITDFGAGSINTIPDWAQFGTELYLTNGVITPRYWDGTTLVNTGATQLGAPTLADAGAGPLNGSGYKYRLVPILANKQRKPGSVASASLDVQNRRITVSWTADADTNVIGYELYRTTGSGLDFYLVSYVDVRTTATYVGDSLPDADLLTRQALSVVAAHGDPPPVGSYFCVAHKRRVWWGRTDTYPLRWWWSDPGDADSVYQDRSYTELVDQDSLGDVSTGGTGDFEGMIVLWCERSVWTVSGTGIIANGEIDWRKRRSNAKTGTVNHRTVVRVPKGSVYTTPDGRQITTEANTLAYLTPNKDIRLFDGKGDTIISFPKMETLKLMNMAHARKSYAYDDELHGMFVWVFPSGAATEPNYAVAWNYLYGLWHEWTAFNFGHAAVIESSSETGIVLTGEARTATGAFVYKMWTGDTRDGASITGTLMTKPLYPPVQDGGPPDARSEKRMESLTLLFAKDAAPTNVTVGVLPHDAADGDTPTVTRTIAGSSRVRVPLRQQAADLNPGKFFYGVGCRLKLSSTATSGPWILQMGDLQYQVLRGTTR